MKCGETMNKKQNWVIIILFLVLIFGMTGVSLLKPDREFSEKENRSLAQSPMLSVEDYFSGAFAKDYEAYITDQFILRDEWIGMKTKVERAVGKQEINDIYFAKTIISSKSTQAALRQIQQSAISPAWRSLCSSVKRSTARDMSPPWWCPMR